MEELRRNYLTKRKERSDKVRDIINQGRTKIVYSPGDLVHVRNLRIAEVAGSSLASKFSGPYLILEVDEKRQQCLLQNRINRQKRICHKTRLLRIFMKLTLTTIV